jgi:hypothetical protein
MNHLFIHPHDKAAVGKHSRMEEDRLCPTKRQRRPKRVHWAEKLQVFPAELTRNEIDRNAIWYTVRLLKTRCVICVYFHLMCCVYTYCCHRDKNMTTF